MTLHLTPDILEACYNFHRTLPPFAAWHLPESDEIVFRVGGRLDRFGSYDFIDGCHVLMISENAVGHVETLSKAISHEMIHLRQAIIKTEPKGKTQHNAQFRHISRRVCRLHGYDPKEFV
jgi:hypothetical protein